MAYDENAARRVRTILEAREGVREVRMMGGLIFMVNGHMCCGVHDRSLMIRVGADRREEFLRHPHVGPLDIGRGRQPKAFLRVEPAGFEADDALTKWIGHALDFVGTLPPKP